MKMLMLTDHAAIRMAQRSIRSDDPNLIALIGTGVEGGYFVRDQDCQKLEQEMRQAEQEIKTLRERLRRLRGKRLVVVDGRVVTAYHTAKKNQRRLMRSVSERDLS
jgi:hypothetical protein